MNSKSYINYFPEIAHLRSTEQESLLEQARYIAFTTLGLSGKSALFLVLSMLGGFAIFAVSFAVFDYSLFINGMAAGVGGLFGVLLNRKLQAGLPQEGLKHALKSDVLQ